MTVLTIARMLLLAGSGAMAVKRLIEARPAHRAASSDKKSSAFGIARAGLADASVVTSGRRGGALRQVASEAFHAARMRRSSPALATALLGFAVWRTAAAFMARGRR